MNTQKKWIAKTHEYLPGFGVIQEEGEGMTIAVCLEAENATLLASAPELLEALKSIIEWQDCDRMPRPQKDMMIRNAARAAIAKATQTL